MHRKPILFFLFVTSALSILYPSPKANAMLFKSDIFISDSAGAGWDTWGCFHNGTYYLYYQIKENATYGQGFGVANSSDGVHWTDHGWAIHESDKNTYYCGSGSIWKSADYDTSGKFICNYSEHRQVDGKRTQNILFAWSTDFIHWTKYDDKTVFKVDTRYFIEHGRWDCISTFPRAEGGYWGTWTASGKEVKGTVGIGYSEDGLHWITLPPPVIEPGVSESGGMYSIKGPYPIFNMVSEKAQVAHFNILKVFQKFL